MIHPL
jgi:hypothetical protein